MIHGLFPLRGVPLKLPASLRSEIVWTPYTPCQGDFFGFRPGGRSRLVALLRLSIRRFCVVARQAMIHGLFPLRGVPLKLPASLRSKVSFARAGFGRFSARNGRFSFIRAGFGRFPARESCFGGKENSVRAHYEPSTAVFAPEAGLQTRIRSVFGLGRPFLCLSVITVL